MPAYDYRTSAEITVTTTGGAVIFRDQLLGAPDAFQAEAEFAEAHRAARILNPDLSPEILVTATITTAHGTQTKPALPLGTLSPVHAARIPEVHSRFLGKHPNAREDLAAEYRARRARRDRRKIA